MSRRGYTIKVTATFADHESYIRQLENNSYTGRVVHRSCEAENRIVRHCRRGKIKLKTQN